jgi:hypothetical protein
LKIEVKFEHGRYNGTIKMGNDEFPFDGDATPDGFAGTFRSGANQFQFTATIRGNEMLFVTGGSSYTLTKAAINPLGGASEPQNPLGGGGGQPQNPLGGGGG